MGKNTFFGKLGALAGDALEKVDTDSASKAVSSALDAAQKATGGLGRKADPLVKRAKEATPRLIDKAKGALTEDRGPAPGGPGGARAPGVDPARDHPSGPGDER